MARKVLISFLGTGNYKECVYRYKQEKSKVVKFIQTAVINLLAPDFDQYIAFCTEEASAKHFKSLNLECGDKFKEVKIPRGFTESEIWEIFQIVFEQLEEGDKVIFDVTHSFRSIPMLGITLLQYAKFIKNISVVGIYYGAFETLGPAHEIENHFPNPEDRIAPILDLTSFSILQDWTVFGSQFINTGNVTNLAEIAYKSSNQILKNTKGQNQEAQKLKKISQLLKEIGNDFSTNRGTSFLLANNILQVKNLIDELEKDITIPAFNPILEKLNNEFKQYNEDNEENLFLSVQWCIDKGLIQQGITQLQEAVVTILCKKVGCKFTDRGKRNIVSSYLQFGFHKPKDKWKEPLNSEVGNSISEELQLLKNIEEIVKAYNSLSEKRNDINHGGYLLISAESNKFADALLENYNILKNLL